MNQALRLLFLSYLALVLASCAKPKAEKDCGYVQNVYGERVSWKQNSPVRMYLHTSIPVAYEPAIRAAADSWNKAHRNDLIVIDPNRVGGSPARDGKNVIYLLSTWEADRSSEQARTSLYWVGDQIQEADIRINAHNYQFYVTHVAGITQAVSIQALVLHELGHVIGLRHNDATPSVMATYLKANQDRIELQAAVMASLQCEY
jgi:hypothetical protein